MSRRVVITGIGCVSPLGNNASKSWEGIKAGKNGIDYITKFDTENFKAKLAAEVKDFEIENYIDRKDARKMDLFTQYGIAASSEAVEDSGLDLEKIDRFRFGVIVGSGIGGISTIEDNVIKMEEKGPAKVSPLFIPMSIGNIVAGNIAIKFGAKGVCTSLITACATGTSCIGEAFRNIKDGYSDVILTGGTDAAVTRVSIAGFTSITAATLSQDKDRASIPFDKERNGFVMGEGAGIVILEELEHAQSRGAKIYGEVVGYGATCDAFHITSPPADGEGLTNAIKYALNEGNVDLQEVTYINAHGTSTPTNDRIETLVVKNVFGDLAYKIPVSSTKSMTGHMMGAGGAMEAIITTLALKENIAPPTIGLKVADEECDLNYVANKAQQHEMKYGITNSLGFGGHNAVLCLKKWGA